MFALRPKATQGPQLNKSEYSRHHHFRRYGAHTLSDEDGDGRKMPLGPRLAICVDGSSPQDHFMHHAAGKECEGPGEY